MVYLLRADMVYESFVPDKHYRDLRSLSKDRIGMAGAGAGQKNRITATMAKYDYRSPTKSKFGKKGPARRAARDALARLSAQLRGLMALIGGKVAPALGAPLGFNALDGD